ncbi:hypothetical protein QFZ37_002271 [Chryseobacterium ginsenosidimutans]|uniref:hypothetical protein n=1 Tax=Chryseobacterium ginsenosidimutans TaxID=687846 RepID=UPI00278314A0|nr:hypothetical protein [Chryseobacterium ginsenosidimutans]MDQ0593902.1 hypothetical protein [Chryseobacterium ginsenosidimutans]
MYPKIYLSLTALLAATFLNAQVMISKTAGSAHQNALLDIKDGTKGVIFTRSESIGSFPLYNNTQEDYFNDEPALEGAILYNKEDKQYYKYDGTTWIPALQLGGWYNPFLTRRKANNSKTWNCLGVQIPNPFPPFTPITVSTCSIFALLGSNNKQTISLSPVTNRSQLLVNNLNTTMPTNNGDNVIQIPQAGLYHISAVTGFGGFSLASLGKDATFWVSIDVSYNGGANWSTLAFEETKLYGGVFIDLGQGGNKSASVSASVTLPANSQIRLQAAVNTDAVLSTFSNSVDHRETFVNIQKLR